MVPSAVLPNPAEPGVIAVGGAFGAILGRALARALRYDADKQMRWFVEGSYYGSSAALVLYLFVNFIEVIS